MRRVVFILLPLLVCVLMLSCKPQVPGKYLQPDEMEDILFDYHIAMGMIEGDDSDDAQKRLYEASVLKKHGVSRAEFDSSLVYYTRHSDRLLNIYENLQKRLGDEAVSLGASVSDVGNFGENAASDDTTNVWNEASSCVLATQAPYNVQSFCLKADTAYHKGDRMILSFNSQFIFQDGYKDGVAMLAVRFCNDSVGVRTIHIQEANRYDLTVDDDEGLGIKEVRGFFCLQNQPSASLTTLKLMFITNIRLVRCHIAGFVPKRKEAAAAMLSSDSSQVNVQKPVGGKPMNAPVPSQKRMNVPIATQKPMDAPVIRRMNSLK